MVVKVKGEFNWHSHPETDDFFLVLHGTLRIDLRDSNGDATSVDLAPGEQVIEVTGTGISFAVGEEMVLELHAAERGSEEDHQVEA